jgi:hypothetical protein
MFKPKSEVVFKLTHQVTQGQDPRSLCEQSFYLAHYRQLTQVKN